MRAYRKMLGVAVRPEQNLYPIDSPHACARIVAVALVCDGEVTRPELAMLNELQVLERLGLSGAEFQSVVSDLCADLLATAKAEGDDECRIDPMLIERWMSGVHDPALQRAVLSLCSAVIQADGYLQESESMLMHAAIEHWGIRPEGLGAFDPLSSEVDIVLPRRRRAPVPDRPRHAVP